MKAFIAACLATAAYSFEMLAPVTDGNGSWSKMTITEDGVPKDLYVAMGTSESNGNTLNIPFNNRGYWSLTPSLDPNQFYKPNLLGGYVEYDVDLSQSNCGCVAAFYMVSMPGKNSAGQVEPSEDNMYYCDANQVGGNYCPEFDIMEANQWTAQTTPHSCDSPSNGHYWNCNRGGGCWQNTKNQLSYNDYGPGDQFKINTYKTFHAKLDFNSNGQFDSFKITYSQDGKSVSMDSGYCQETINMTNDVRNGMAFAFSSWSTYDNWLWGDRCQASNCNSHNLYFRNINIKTGGSSPNPPNPPTPGNYSFGDSCATPYDDDCNGCNCHWSWPSNESWNSPNAKCRCM